MPQSHSRSIGVAGCCPGELGVSREVELLASSHTSPSPHSTEAGPELRARILESFIMASEVAELPTAPGKRCLAGGRGGTASVTFRAVITAGHGAVLEAGAVTRRRLCPCGSAQAPLASCPISLSPFSSETLIWGHFFAAPQKVCSCFLASCLCRCALVLGFVMQTGSALPSWGLSMSWGLLVGGLCAACFGE